MIQCEHANLEHDNSTNDYYCEDCNSYFQLKDLLTPCDDCGNMIDKEEVCFCRG